MVFCPFWAQEAGSSKIKAATSFSFSQFFFSSSVVIFFKVDESPQKKRQLGNSAAAANKIENVLYSALSAKNKLVETRARIPRKGQLFPTWSTVGAFFFGRVISAVLICGTWCRMTFACMWHIKLRNSLYSTQCCDSNKKFSNPERCLQKSAKSSI